MWHNVPARGNAWHRLAFYEALGDQHHATVRDHTWHNLAFYEALGAKDSTVKQCGTA